MILIVDGIDKVFVTEKHFILALLESLPPAARQAIVERAKQIGMQEGVARIDVSRVIKPGGLNDGHKPPGG